VTRYLATALVLLMSIPALGHDHWINHGKYLDPVTGQHCCNENDCKQVSELEREKWTFNQDGTIVVPTQSGSLTFQKSQLHVSEDGLWYRCVHRCIFRPSGT